MAKTLCKYRRVDIADKVSDVCQMVSDAHFICLNCTRVAGDSTHLCQPNELSNSVKATTLSTVNLSDNISSQSTLIMDTSNIHHISSSAVAEQSDIEIRSLVRQEELSPQLFKFKQMKKLRKLAKKKNKRLKKAEKAIKKFEKQLKKAKDALVVGM